MKEKCTVKEYMHAFRKQSYPGLFSAECIKSLSHVEKAYGDTCASEVGFEIPMGEAPLHTDYSICVKTPEAEVAEYWLEMDYEAYKDGGGIKACVFYDAARAGTGYEDKDFYERVLPSLFPELQGDRERLIPALKKTVALLEGRCEALYQIGSMAARGPSESGCLRIYTGNMKREDILAFLSDCAWTGNMEMLGSFLTKWESCSREFVLSFDLSSDGISDKIGINFGTRSVRLAVVDKLLLKLEKEGFLLSSKRQEIERWIRACPQAEPLIQNDLSHVKFTIKDGMITAAKAYLRQSGRFLSEEAPALSVPFMMNLELTTKCPPHCPQCYVSLNTGKELPLETALSALRDGAACGVRLVNLSGGETLCYPHLDRLVSECVRLCLECAVALSGAYASRERLTALIEAGVSEIYVSLNGSTEEVNRCSRDGYDLAVRTLALLKDLGFKHTCINWVMHRSNAEDFPEMIKLAESYGVEKLIILGFKPDAKGELPGYPTALQLRALAHMVKAYEGELVIDAESCFSQLRALIHNGLFGNRNRGISRGCGAGRDGISVNVDGKLTPCRHLDIPEEWPSIQDYWEKSGVLSRLRSISAEPEGACVSCKFHRYCIPCADVGYRLHDRLAFRMEECPLAQEEGGLIDPGYRNG